MLRDLSIFPHHRCCRFLLAVLLLLLTLPSAATTAASIDCQTAAGILSTPPSISIPSAFRLPPSAIPAGSLTVFAAASLSAVFTTLQEALQTANPGLDIRHNFAGSPTLVTQVEEGAPADLLALASPSQMQRASDAGLLDGSPVTFAGNRLALIVPADNPASINTIADLSTNDLRLVLAAPGVPAGDYARALLCRVASVDAALEESWLDQVAANIASEELDVHAVLTRVRLGEADAGIVYVTDITPDLAAEVTVVPVPATNDIITLYQIAVTTTEDRESALAYIAALLSPLGQTLLADAGFITVAELTSNGAGNNGA